jgi:hypothetical protein
MIALRDSNHAIGVPIMNTSTLNAEQLRLARDWIKDCLGTFRDLEDEEEIDALTDTQVIKGISRHYSGGIQAFIEAC